MKVALVTSNYGPRVGVVERHVHELAVGLAARGVGVEILTQDVRRRLPSISDFDGFVTRRFAVSFGNTQFAVAPGLWDHLRRTAALYDVVHAHGAHAPLALAALRARPQRLVFTPHTPVRRLLRRPYSSLIRTFLAHGARILCTAETEMEVLTRTFPWAGNQMGVVWPGVDIASIQAARPFPYPRPVVLAVGPLERHQRIDRAIAAMAALDPAFRLAVVGDGSAREKLLAHAADLGVSSRVNFVDSVPESELYRWLRTAKVVAALAEQESSGLHLTEGLCAGARVVASDIPVHREAAFRAGGTSVIFVPSSGSPLDVADGVREAAEISLPQTLPLELETWDDAVERTLAVYTETIRETPRIAAVGS